MPNLDRRRFVQASSTAFFGLAFAPPFRPRARRYRPNDEVRAAVIGLRGRGRAHVQALHGLEGVRVVALCDVDEAILAREVELFQARGEDVFAASDLRHVLDREDVDVVSIATPNHWHALATVWACQAGKDVYVEKPVSHTLWEGRQMHRAASCHGRIVQAGMQSRSSSAFEEAFAWMREGHLGALRLARGLCYKARQSIGRTAGPQPLPAGVDFDLWTGPAALRPLHRRQLHYDWHWDFETGNGDLGNQGVHQVDLCLWALGALGLPKSVRSFGGRFGYVDDGNTPNTMVTIADYEPAPLVFEVRGLPPNKAARAASWNNAQLDRYRGVGIGCILECEGGWLELPNYSSVIARNSEGVELQRWEAPGDHFANFIEAVQSGRRQDLTADIELGHLASAVCHTANASYQLGQRAPLDAKRIESAGSEVERECLRRVHEHLVANEIDLTATPVAFGPTLELDAEAERCTNLEQANWLMKRNDRPPFVVPEEV